MPTSPAQGFQPHALQRLALNLEVPPLERAQHWLNHLRQQQAIWDPDPARVCLLRALGLPAHWLDSGAPTNGWLQQPAAAGSAIWARQLGLAPPPLEALIVLGSGGAGWDRALALEMERVSASEGGALTPPLAYVPAWTDPTAGTAETAIARAGWLWAAASRAERLVWLEPAERELDPLLAAAAPHGLPPLRPDGPLTPQALRLLLQDHSGEALAEDRPSPPCQECFHWQAPEPPQAAVVVSLYNYAARIGAALDSVARQRQRRLELVVVDDASSDDGVAVVQAWMADRLQTGEHPFVRLLLLRHAQNAGLAATRNSGFAAARAPWCFVLDADNALYPDAVAQCLALAHVGQPDLAVVHPLIAVDPEPGRSDEQRTLVGTQSWQRERFRVENQVDAMALVRHSAWQAAGGYTHIEGGWEDYDFWCKLIDAGFHGLQCPQVLAVYRSHCQSMSHQATNTRWRSLARTLQRRHPWLDLALAH